MPHVTIQHYPREFSPSDKERLAAKVADAIREVFGCADTSISIAMEPVPRDHWTAEVYQPKIQGQAELLIKKPGY